MDAVLMFDVLMYLNGYYYPLTAICHPVMIIAKFFSPNFTTPEKINIDAGMVTTLILADLLKLLIYRKIRDTRQVIAVVIAVFLTVVSFSCIIYIFAQRSTMKMEYILCSTTSILYITELLFGILQLFPCLERSPFCRMDAELMFEVLLYLNVYYFGVFCVSEILIVLAKYFSPVLSTPNIDVDGAVLSVILTAELAKLIFFKKIRGKSTGLSNFLVIATTSVSITGLLYVLVIQNPVLKMEYIVCGIMLALLVTIIIYGFLQYVPFCQRRQYD